MKKTKDIHTLDVKSINTDLEEGRLLIRPHWSGDGKKFYTHISDYVLNDAGEPTYRLGEWFDNDFMIWSEYMTVEYIKTNHDFLELNTAYLE